MAASPADPTRTLRRNRRLWLAVALAAAVLLVLLLALYLARGPIGASLVVSYLRSRGVPAQVRFQRLDAKGFVASVRLGPPGDPDLVVPRLEATVAPGAWFKQGVGVPQFSSIVMNRPELKLAWDGKRLRYGSLQPLIDELLSRPPSGAPPPDLTASAARIRLDTPSGRLLLTGDAKVAAGRLQALSARLAPTRLAGQGVTADLASGTVAVSTLPQGMSAQLRLRLPSLAAPQAKARDVTLALDASGPSLPLGGKPAAMPVDLKLSAQAASLDAPAGKATAAKLDASFGGRLDLASQLVSARGKATATLSAKSATAQAGAIEGLAASLASTDLAVTAGKAGTTLAAPITGRLALARAGAGDLAVQAVSWSGSGKVAAGQAVTADLRGALAARSAIAAPAALRLAANVPIAGTEPPGRRALARFIAGAALSAPDLRIAAEGGKLTLTAGRPIRIAAPAASAVIAPRKGPLYASAGSGAFDLSASGADLPTLKAQVSAYRLGPGAAWSATSGFDAAFSTSMFRGTKLSGAARFDSNGRVVTIVPAGCLKVAVDAAGVEGPPVVTAAAGALCPRPGAAFFTAAGAGWSLKGEARDARFEAPQMMAKVTAAAARLDLNGSGANPPGGEVVIETARVEDAKTPAMFLPVKASGSLASPTGQVWSGRVQLAEAAHGRAFAAVEVRHDVPSGVGTARIDASSLVFAKDGLQPVDVLPIFKGMASQAEGTAAFTGQIGWSGSTLTSSGRFSTAGLSFRSMAGRLTGLATTLEFSSLLPLVTAGDQSLTAMQLDALTPLTGLKASFAMDEAAIHLKSAEADTAGGHLALGAMELSFDPKAETTGSLGFTGIDLAKLIAASNLSDRVQVTARLDGGLTFRLAPDGFHVVTGHAAATGPGRLSIYPAALGGVAATSATPAAPGAPAPAAPAPGPMQDIAFQALQDLAFTQMDATLAPQAGGRLQILFHINGQHDPAVDPKPTINVLDVIRGKGFDKPIPLPKGTPINLTLDTSLNFDQLLQDYLAATRGSAEVHP